MTFLYQPLTLTAMKRFRFLPVFTLLSLSFTGIMTPVNGYAQDCGIQEESIVRMRLPDYTSLRSWYTIWGEDGYDRFRDITPIDNKDGGQDYVIVGDYTNDEEDAIYKPFIVRMTNRGESVWTNRENTQTDYRPVSVLPAKDSGYVVVGDTRTGDRAAIYFAHYDDGGVLKARKAIADKSGSLNVSAMDRLHDGSGYIVAGQFTRDGDDGSTNGVIFKISNSGDVIWRRSYKPGNATLFHDVHSNGDGSYMVSGQIRLEDGRMAGWAIRLNDKGAIDWQQTYPRGRNAALRGSDVFRDGGFVFAGDVEPSGGGRKSGWVMAVNQGGDVIWQRYYTADYNYVGYDVLYHDDGRVDALISGKALDGRLSTPHIRVLTHSPRGFLMGVSDHTEGQGAGARRMIKNNKQERIVIGTEQATLPANVSQDSFPPYTFDAWSVALPPLEVYQDPCLVNPLDDIRPVDTGPL